MNFRHPEEVMRARILGLTLRCKNCAYFKNNPAWCTWRKSNEAPGTRVDGYDVCPEFTVRRPA